jgi:hypothetical protein
MEPSGMEPFAITIPRLFTRCRGFECFYDGRMMKWARYALNFCRTCSSTASCQGRGASPVNSVKRAVDMTV